MTWKNWPSFFKLQANCIQANRSQKHWVSVSLSTVNLNLKTERLIWSFDLFVIPKISDITPLFITKVCFHVFLRNSSANLFVMLHWRWPSFTRRIEMLERRACSICDQDISFVRELCSREKNTCLQVPTGLTAVKIAVRAQFPAIILWENQNLKWRSL